MASLKQIAASNKPSCALYSQHKKILDETSFLPEDTTFKIRYWYYNNKLTEAVRCACGCQTILKYPNLSKYAQGHSNSAEEVKEKKKQNLIKKYGPEITNVSQLQINLNFF